MTFFPASCQAVVNRVIDGDTYVAEFENREYIIRIIGCDCFETRYTAKLRAQARKHGIPIVQAYQKGIAAKHFAENLLLGQTVHLTRPNDSPDNDPFYRYLRIVEVQCNNAVRDIAQLLTMRGHVA